MWLQTLVFVSQLVYQGNASHSKSAYWCTRQYTTWHHGIWTSVHSSFHCSQPFCSLFHCSWWFGRTQNKTTTWQPGILCGWSGRLEQSTTGRSFGTDIINVQMHAQDTSSLPFLICWLTVSRVRAANIVRRISFSAYSHVTAPYKLSFYFIIYCYHYFDNVFQTAIDNLLSLIYSIWLRTALAEG